MNNYQSQPIKFSTYINGTNGNNGITPEIKNGYWWIGSTNTGVKAEGVDGTDGVSFSGVVEYYYATLADNKDGYPTKTEDGKQVVDLSKWYDTIEDTKFGTKATDGKTYKYLWNVEGVQSIDANGTSHTDYTNPELLQIYSGGRVPAEYISYYASSHDSGAPGQQPGVSTDGNSLTNITNNDYWSTTAEAPDSNNYLFEITFVKYAEKDENGKNLYAKMSGPTIIGHSGADAMTLELDNDSDVIAKTASGTILGTDGELSVVNASVVKNGVKVSDASVQIHSKPDSFVNNTNYTFVNNTLTITSLPTGFSSGKFVFTYNNLYATYNLSVTLAENDYNLIIPKSVINSTDSGGEIEVKVEKIGSDGTKTILSSSNEVEITFSGSSSIIQSGWEFTYPQDESVPLQLTLKDKEGSFVWDTETIEFVRDGSAATDFNITTNSYTLKNIGVDEQGNSIYEGSVTLTANPINIEANSIDWYEGDSNTLVSTGTSYQVTKPGLYTAKIRGTEWVDSIQIIEIADGEKGGAGAPAISIILTNPTMTFHTEYSDDEECEVIIMEGGDELTANIYSYGLDDGGLNNGEFAILFNGDGDVGALDGDIYNKFIIYPKTEKGSTSITIAIKTSDGKYFEKQYPINWIVVEDGKNGETDYYIYHDATEENETLMVPQDKDYRHFPSEKGETYDGWYTIQTEDSYYYCNKQGAYTPDEQATISWHGPEYVNPQPITYDDMWGALNTAVEEDTGLKVGVYPFTIGEGENAVKCLGINADLIKTGALCVGDTPDFNEETGEVVNWKNNVLYAAMDMPEDGSIPLVHFAGWKAEPSVLSSTSEKVQLRTNDALTVFGYTSPVRICSMAEKEKKFVCKLNGIGNNGTPWDDDGQRKYRFIFKSIEDESYEQSAELVVTYEEQILDIYLRLDAYLSAIVRYSGSEILGWQESLSGAISEDNEFFDNLFVPKTIFVEGAPSSAEIVYYYLDPQGSYILEDGTFIATQGKIGTWYLSDNGITDKKDSMGSVGMYNGTGWTSESLVTPGTQSPVRFYAGATISDNGVQTANFAVLEDGSAYMTAAKIGAESIISNGTSAVSFGDFITRHNQLNSNIMDYSATADNIYENAEIEFTENYNKMTVEDGDL